MCLAPSFLPSRAGAVTQIRKSKSDGVSVVKPAGLFLYPDALAGAAPVTTFKIATLGEDLTVVVVRIDSARGRVLG